MIKIGVVVQETLNKKMPKNATKKKNATIAPKMLHLATLFQGDDETASAPSVGFKAKVLLRVVHPMLPACKKTVFSTDEND